ncbi:hypothetical protein QOZ80_6BG0470940 [Eleusine coracana subsp. coracana]|nr:hypothetical protein QOZ80_6BG0470940 [Eleusine coracana subsp. coracana]
MDLPESSSSQPPPPWAILGRVARVEHDSVDEPGELSVELALPPRVSTISVPMSLHPKPNYDDRDKHPYVVAADPEAGLLLLQVSHWPFVGFDLDENPKGALLVARGFLPADLAAGRDAPVAIAARVPDRALSGHPHISNIKNVGLVSRPGTGGADYVVAELRLDRTDVDRATLLSFRSGSDAWVETELSCPSMKHARRMWSSSHDVIAHDGKLWWVNLVWGLLACDPFQDKPVLRYIKLPEYDVVHDVVDPPSGIESSRMVRVSKSMLLFVEMTRNRVDPVEETIVVVRSLQFNHVTGETRWRWMSGNSVGVMWASNSYKAAGMPDGEVPVLALVHPTEPDVLYFFLRDYLFGFDMLMSRVTKFVYKPGLVDVVAGTRRPPSLSWRYVLAWELPPSLANALDDLMDEDGDSPFEDSDTPKRGKKVLE